MTKESGKNTIGANLVEENRGREESRNEETSKNRGKSKDFLSSLEKRMMDVETSMDGLKAQVEETNQHVEVLDSDFADMRDDFKSALNALGGDLRRELHDLRGMFMSELAKFRGEVEVEISTIHQHLEEIQADVSLAKRVMASGSGNTSNHVPKVDFPKPSPFVGKRDARAVDDFLWEIEQYMDGVNIVEDTMKIKTATRYLKDTAALWWRRRYGDIERGTCNITTWGDFIREFKKQFYPENAEDEARSRLRKLKHSGTIREYVKEFTNLILEIPNLSNKDSLFYFLDGLQAWARRS